jgi:hypothetical protein
MTDPAACEEIRASLAELATNAATGHDRARALEHLAACPTCRDEMAQLTRTADALLLLAPGVEPPPGFETRVLAALEANPPTANTPTTDAPTVKRWPRPRHLASLRRRGRRPLSPAAAGAGGRRTHAGIRAAAAVVTIALALAGGAAFAHRRGEQDRQLAQQYRQTLRVAGGSYLTAAPLTTPGGERAGSVFLYQGNPSWILVTVTAAPADGAYRMLVIDDDGASHPAGTCHITNGNGTAGYRLRVPISRIDQIQLRAPGDTDLHLTART